MSSVTALFVGLIVMLLVSSGVLLLLRHSLHLLLVELCGEEHRARFWGQLYSATVVLTVGLTGILFPPEAVRAADSGGLTDSTVPLFGLLPMFRAGLFGLLLCLGLLALTMVRFIARNDRRREDAGTTAKA